MQEEMDKGKIKRITIDQKKLNTLSAELNEIAENLQNKIVIEKNVALSKNSITGDFKSWKESKKIEQTNLKKNVDSQIIKSKEILNNALIDAIKQINEPGEEITAEQIKEFKGIKIFKTANNALELTSKQVIKDFRTDVVNVYKLRNQEPLFDAIMKQSNKGIEEGIKIAYKNGRQYSFRSYMEMNVRTTVRQEANEFLFKASRSNGVVFYLSNYFSDSADDHSSFQNCYFYDKNWRSFGYDEETTKKIEKAISKYHMISYQDVTEKPPYLTTRPNCRHILKPVLLDDVFSKTPKQAGEDYGMRKGTYKSSNYKDLQTQRLNERNIRKYKARLENDLKMQQHMKSPQMSAQIEQDKRLIKYWQDRQKVLVAQNSVLKRDYRRENPKIVVFDAGVRYNKGIVKPTTPKTPTEATKEPTPSVKVKVTRDTLPKDFYKKVTKKEANTIETLFENANAPERETKIMRNLYKTHSKMFFETKSGERCFWNGDEVLIRIGKEKFQDEDSLKQAVFHELGHAIDYTPVNDTGLYRSLAIGKENGDDIFKQKAKELNEAINEAEENTELRKDIFSNAEKFRKERSRLEWEDEQERINNDPENQKYNEMVKKQRGVRNQLNDDLIKDKISYKEYEKKIEILSQEREPLEKVHKAIVKKQEEITKSLVIQASKDIIGGSGYQDILDAIFSGKLQADYKTFGHGTDYYYGIGNKKKEMMANFFEMKVNQRTEDLEKLKTKVPKIYNTLDGIFDLISNRIKE